MMEISISGPGGQLICIKIPISEGHPLKQVTTTRADAPAQTPARALALVPTPPATQERALELAPNHDPAPKAGPYSFNPTFSGKQSLANFQEKAGRPIALTVDQVSELVGKTRHTIRNWIRDGILPGHKEGREWIIYRADLEAYLQKLEGLLAEERPPAVDMEKFPAVAPVLKRRVLNVIDRRQVSMQEDDQLIEEALRAIQATGPITASRLQRELRIGYTRAARIVALMEQRGLIGPTTGTTPGEKRAAVAEEARDTLAELGLPRREAAAVVLQAADSHPGEPDLESLVEKSLVLLGEKTS